MLGPAAGGAAYGPALTDVVVLGPEGRHLRHQPTSSAPSPAATSTCCASAVPSRTEPSVGRRAHPHRVRARGARPAQSPPSSAPRAAWRSSPSRTVTSARRSCRSTPTPPTTCTRSSTSPARRGHHAGAACPLGPQHRHHPAPASAAAPSASSPTTRCASAAASTHSQQEGFVPLRAHVRRLRGAAGRARRRFPATSPASARSGTVVRGAKLLHAFGEYVVRASRLRDPQDLRRRLHRDEHRSLGATRVFAWPGRRGRHHGRRRGHTGSCTDASWRRIFPEIARRSTSSPPSTSGSPAASTRPWRSGAVDEVVDHPHAQHDRARHAAPRSTRRAYAAAVTATSPLRASSTTWCGRAQADAFAGVPEGLELVVPRLAEQVVDLEQQRGVAEGGLHHRGLRPGPRGSGCRRADR